MLVLVVDDNAVLCATIVDHLRQCGHEVYEATDGRRALEIASKFAASLQAVITDIEMPLMDGVAMWEHIRRIVSPIARSSS
jgi:CheY-like chemotaxis protein